MVPVIPDVGKPQQRDDEFMASLRYMWSCLETKQNKTNKHGIPNPTQMYTLNKMKLYVN